MNKISILILCIFFLHSCDNEPIFENCTFPYDTISWSNSTPEDAIDEEDLPSEIVETLRNKYQNVTELRGAVINHCTREELLYVVTGYEEIVIEIDQNGNEIEDVQRKGAFDLYNNCGEFVGDGIDVPTATVEAFYRQYIEEIIGQNVGNIWDITIFTFEDGKTEYYFDIHLSQGKTHILIKEDTEEYCILD